MCSSVSSGLKSTKKGQLKYISSWDKDGLSAKEFFDTLLPSPCLSLTQLSDSSFNAEDDDCNESHETKPSGSCSFSARQEQSSLHNGTVSGAQLSKSDSYMNDVIKSPRQHYLETELCLVTRNCSAKYKEALQQKLQQFILFGEKLSRESQLQREAVQQTLIQNAENNFQQLCEIERKHTEEAEVKLSQLSKVHQLSARDQSARREKDKERLKSLEDERRRNTLASLTSSQDLTASYSRDFVSLLATCRYPQHLSASASACREVMNEITNKVAFLVSRAQRGEAVDDDIIKASELAKEAKKIVSSMEVHVADANKRGDDEAARKAATAAAEAQRQQTSASEPAVSTPQTVSTTPAATRDVSASSSTAPQRHEQPSVSSSQPILLPNVPDDVVAQYQSQQNLLERTIRACESFTKDSRFKKERFDLQKAVNTPVNGISPSTCDQVLDKLCRVLSGQAVDIGSNRKVSARDHEIGVPFCKQLLAKKIVKQGEEQVSANHDSAFLIARIAVGIWCEFPDVGDLILAYFHQMCPYLVPYYFPLRDNQGSREDYFRSLGYLIQENGEIEQQDKFLRRMSGFVRLYAAVTVTPLTALRRHRSPSATHPHGVEHAWTWLARVANVEPRPDITATAIGDFLSVAGYALHRTYGRQFVKLVKLIADEYMPKIRAVTQTGSGGPVTRLEGLLRDAASGRLPQPPRHWT